MATPTPIPAFAPVERELDEFEFVLVLVLEGVGPCGDDPLDAVLLDRLVVLVRLWDGLRARMGAEAGVNFARSLDAHSTRTYQSTAVKEVNMLEFACEFNAMTVGVVTAL